MPAGGLKRYVKGMESLRTFTKPAVGSKPSPRADGLLANLGPIDLEIGCGVGLHPIRRALEHPERSLIALEHTRVKFDKFWGRYLNHNEPKNLAPVHDNAISWVADHDFVDKFEEIFLLYPNPNPKRRNQRWFCMPFFVCLIRSLKPGGRVTLATNLEFYFNEARAMALEEWKLTVISAGVYEGVPRTHFEKKYMERGETCYQLVVQKPRLS